MTSDKISIVVPTYREAENTPVLLQEIDAVMNEAGLSYEVIVVDDDSKDGIVEVVAHMKDRYNVTLRVRKNEKGLSSAVLAGIASATGGIVVVMDADLSHPPRNIPDLVTPILNHEFDFVIGSRFVKGGSTVDFNWYRKLNAWASRMLARPLTNVYDPMAGFFAFHKNILDPPIALNPLGFKIGLEILVKASPGRVLEIPIQFHKRLFGESKLSFKEQVRYLIHLKRLFEFKYRMASQFVKFCLIGGSGMLIDLLFVFISMNLFSLWVIFPDALCFRASRAIGFAVALTNNFILNRRFTFASANGRNIYGQYMTFFAVSLVGFVINWSTSVLLYENNSFFHTHYLVAAFMGILAGTLVNFFGSKYIVFKES
jgi:dolichol-phosphate mannosyltransferase